MENPELISTSEAVFSFTYYPLQHHNVGLGMWLHGVGEHDSGTNQ